MNTFWNFSLHEALKKRVCRYLLQHYLGTFLAKKISLDQLTVDITKGRGIVSNIELDVQSLNEVLRNQNIPLEMVEGVVDEISVSIPWSALVSEPSVVEVRGLRVTLTPNSRVDAMVSSQLLDSMLGSMVTSMQVAETCVREMPEERQSGTEGVQRIANTIDTVLSKIRVTLLDSRVTLMCRLSSQSLSLQLLIGQAEYFDTTETPCNDSAASNCEEQTSSSFSNVLLYKSLRLTGLTIFIDDAPLGFSSSSGPPTPPHFGSPVGMPSLQTLTPPSSPAGVQQQQRKPIKVAEIMGQSEIRLVLKREDHLPGPKFDCTISAGQAIHVLLSPTQLHQLLQTFEAFSGKPRDDGERHRRRHHQGDSAGSSRPLSLDDRQKIEEQLLSTSLGQPGQPDDAGSLESGSEVDEGEQFYSMGPMEETVPPVMTDSYRSDSTWQPGRNWAATASDSSDWLRRSKKYSSSATFVGADEETPTRVVGLTGQLALLSITVLHIDPETTHDGIDRSVSGRDKLAALAESFFSLIRGLDVNEQPQNLRALRRSMVDLCPHDHLGFIARPLKLSHTMEESRKMRKSSFCMSMGLADFTETLFERKAEPSLALPKPSDLEPRLWNIVSFPDQSLNSGQPSIRAEFSHAERRLCREEDRQSSLKLSLASCLIDVDLTLMDRLSAFNACYNNSHPSRSSPEDIHHVFGQQPFSSVASDISLGGSTSQICDEFSDADRLDIRLESPHVQLVLHFPVPDLRPPGQRQARWYKKVARAEWLELQLRQLSFLGALHADADFAIEASCADGLTSTLCSETERIRFAESWRCPPEASQAVDGISEAARLHVRVRPARGQRLLPDSLGFSATLPAAATPCGLGSLGTPPMDTLLLNPARGASPFSSKRDIIGKAGGGSGQHSLVWETRVLPADPSEMAEFRASAASNSRLMIELTLARCLINTDCQSNLELLYNRLLNDLALWQPAPHSPCDQRTFLPAHINFAEMLGSAGTSFPQQYASCRSSRSAWGSEDEDEARRSSGKPGILDPQQQQQQQQQSDFCLFISIKSGRLIGNLPIRARNNENPELQPEQAGAMLVDFSGGEVFTVSGHGGNPNKVYSTVSLGDFHLYHAGDVPFSFFSEPCFNQLTASLPEELQLVLSPNSRSAQQPFGFSVQPMLSLAVDAELKSRLKECSVALLVSRTALHYRMQPRQQMWLSQLMNMFELLDYPIEGYTPPMVRTALHVSFNDIALDYRPTKLPISSVLTVRSAYISSTVQIEANSSGCDFLIENVDLYITDKATSAKWKNDYAHIGGFEVLELSIGMNDATGVLRKPQFILNCSSRGLQLHLCSDSLQALLSFVSHLAAEGDLGESDKNTAEESTRNTASIQQQQQHSVRAGDNSALSSSVMSSIPVQLQEALSDAGAGTVEADDAQDDLGFTIIDEPGLGLSVRSGDFEVKKISRQPIKIDDNFYPVPAGRADRLKEPKQLGIPLDQITLRDISFRISLYGGFDFRPTTATGVSLALRSASYSARDLSSDTPVSGRRSDLCMELQVHKLSMRHSRFPEESQTLQRQVVIVEDFEILDKVATSPIKSFLYRHTSERMPRQTNTPMLSLKLSHQKSDTAVHKSECLLMVSLQPVRLNVDQDAFYFLKDFFTEVSQRLAPPQPSQPQSVDSTDAYSISVGTVNMDPTVNNANATEAGDTSRSATVWAESDTAVMEASRQINLLFDELAHGSIIAQRESEQQPPQSLQPQQQQLYFRCFVFSPDVFIRLDFNGGRFKPSEGALGGIALGLLHLNDVELRLKRLEHRSGLLGIDRLCTYALGEWVSDLRERQKGQVMRGLGPARVFLQLLTGLRDLVWLPVDSWMRHGLLLRGLQRGANSFASSSGAALLDLTGRILGGLQAAAALSQDLLSPLPLAERRRQRRLRAVLRGAGGRGDFREACAGAVRVIRETASDTADEMRAAASEAGVVGIVRQLPGAAISPVVALTGAGHCLTAGAFKHLQPNALTDERHKWKGGSD